jgi:hypothetical protein
MVTAMIGLLTMKQENFAPGWRGGGALTGDESLRLF